ncbi:hypothetical protein PanWU01x14_239020 [Parasponia andersonii]|uniref:GPI-anchored adhesin-like protein n=1 Tax=Parasponia andersonii TaxID=3476 RepID=A0A2P5BHH6_PARAD|nr:hypothetical protein PanWU01x14_239020 [Parasponia andersonii]
MEVEKKRSKGGFLNLFDWNGKSRKKLFANNLGELPALLGAQGSKQGKEDEENLPESGVYRVHVDENEESSSNKDSSDWNSASWATSDDGSGNRAPSVVARLMGLDSLPSANVTECSSSSAPLSNVCLLRAANHDKSNLWSDFYIMEDVYTPNRPETFSRNPVDSRFQRQQNRPIERFQTEVLPPKSAKSIPITHHKLLSPIKNPGFIPTKNVTYIMEAAAKIIEASPRASAKSKVTSNIGPSSVPLRIRNLKEKMEAANKASSSEKPKEAGSLKYNKAQYRNKSTNCSEYMLITQASMDSEKRNFNNTRDKGRSVPLAVQAKTNVQRREVSTSCGNRNFMKQKEQKEVKSNQLNKCQSSLQRSVQKRTSALSSNNVLRPNNQKQNSVSNKDKLTEKGLVSDHPARRTRSSSNSVEPNKTVNKVVVNSKTGLKKMGSVATATQRDTAISMVKNSSQKKRSVDPDFNLEETVAGNSPVSEGERSIKCNVTMNSSTSISVDNRKQGMDVISFTFNSPLKRSPSEKRFGIHSINDKDQEHYPKSFTLSSPGLNVIGADSLSALLEQKLQELTCKVQTYQSNFIREESSASCASGLQDFNIVSTTSRGKQIQRDRTYSCASPSVDGPLMNMNHQWQESEGMEERSVSSNSHATGKELEYQDVSPESSFELSFESGSSAKGSKGCSFSEVQSRISLSCKSEFLPAYGKIESSDTTSFSPTRNLSGKQMTRRFGLTDFDGPSNWELEYVRDVLCNAELALDDFALGDTKKVITPILFDHLENEENGTERNEEECSKLERKVLFDCVSECLELRSQQMFVGTCSRRGTLSPRKEWLAEELYEEILGWKNLADLMVDDLVDKDMSTGIGKWLDLDNEAFEEGLEIEKEVLSSLLDELVSDLMVV